MVYVRKKEYEIKMNIIIAGGGKVGRYLAEQLSREGQDITLIDERPQIVQMMTNQADIQGIVGNCASYSIQKDAGIESADLFIAVTGSDELNLLCCLIAKKAGDCHTIARVRTPVYYKEIRHIKEELGLSMVINPEWASAMEMARLLRFPTAIEIDTFAKGRIELLRVRLAGGNRLLGKSIKDLAVLNQCEILICIVERKKQVIIPDGDMVLEENDIISIVAPAGHANRFFKMIGIRTNRVKNTLIIGGSKIGYYLALRLAKSGIQVKIIEQDINCCESLSEMLPKALIINGDGTDQSVLEEEGLADAESVVFLTNMDEENIMLALYAKKVSNAKVVTKINRNTYDAVLDQLDIGSVIHPKYVTSEYILQYVRAVQNSSGSNVETLYQLADGRAEALEFIVKENNAKMTGIPLMNLDIRPNLLVCAIHRNGRAIIPKGQDQMQVGDSVVVITTDIGKLNDLRDILKNPFKILRTE